MNAIDLMVEEHAYIQRMLKVVRKACFEALENHKVNYDDFYLIIDFIRNYADCHHHKKEENFLFNKMVENLGALGEKTVKYGMLVEHDLGRYYIMTLDKSLKDLKNGNREALLDVIANAVSYADLLERHIEKENNVIYKFAQRELNDEVLKSIDDDCCKFENSNLHIRDKYVSILENLELKYL